MTQINHQQPNHVTPQYSSSHSKQQSSPTGTELGQDSISLSKEFAKGTSSGSVGALSNAKETAKAEQDQKQTEATRATDDAKRVTATKTVAASQADTGIKSQTDKQHTRQKPSIGIDGLNQAQSPPQALKACPYCKGTGCSICRPILMEVKNQSNKAEKAKELDDQQKRVNGIARIKAIVDKVLKIFKPDKIKPDPQTDTVNRHKKRNVNTYAERDHDDT